MNKTYFRVHDHIFSHYLKPRDIAVYCCLCKHRNSGTGVAFPSRKTIARECGIGKEGTVDNIYIETFWKTMKIEIGKVTLLNEQTYAMVIDYYINYYNYLRPHSSLNYRTPLVA